MSNEAVSLKYISRIDTDDTHGWYVRVKRKGHNFQKLFSDQKLGNKDWALIQAMIYTDECVESIEKKTAKDDFAKIKKILKHSRGYSYPVYEVSWQFVKGQTKKKSFSIKKFGEEAALQKAESWARAVNKLLNKDQ